MPTEVDLLLTDGIVITMNATYDVVAAGAVAIHNDAIVAIGPTEVITSQYEAKETLSCADEIIMPGLINAHTHIPMSLLRGLNDDLRLDVWLGYLMPLEREFVTPEFVRLGTQIACAEMIRSGVTSFADMYYYEEDIAEETAVIGMRALLGQTLLMFPAPDAATYEDGVIRCRRFVEKWNGHPLIQAAVAPHAWYTATPELLRAAADLARALDVPLHTHVSETAKEVEDCREQHEMSVVPWLDQHGLLETKLLAAHCVHLTHTEMYQLKKAGAGIAHCPTSNLKLASGIAPVGRMLEVGLHVGVGTDGPASNNDLDMFEEMRLAALLAKTASNDPTIVPARQALEMATIRGAKALHMGHLTGSLEVGKRADLIVVKMSGIHNQPHFHNHPDTIYSRIVYASKSSDVQHVLCNGRWLMRQQQLLTVDEAQAKREAADVAAAIDRFVLERESSPYNKLVLLAGVTRQESFEIQVKVPITDDQAIIDILNKETFHVLKSAHYHQFDHYFLFENGDPDAARLRYREDEYLNEKGEVYQARERLTLLGEMKRQAVANTAQLSRSRYLSQASHSLRFYREYFAPATELAIHKDRFRWRILYQDTDFAINLDKLMEPELPGYFLEIKSRTWSRSDAERKAKLTGELLQIFGIDGTRAEHREYTEVVLGIEED